MSFTNSLYTRCRYVDGVATETSTPGTKAFEIIALTIVRHSDNFDDLLKQDPGGRYTDHQHEI